MNEFFTCPPYATGAFIISLLYIIIIGIYVWTSNLENISDVGIGFIVVASVFGCISFIWAVWGVLNLRRDKSCIPVGFTNDSKWWYPFDRNKHATINTEQ